MPQRVVYNLDWRTRNLNESAVHDFHADYTYVPSNNDVAEKADLPYVNNMFTVIQESMQNNINAISQETNEAIAALQESFQNALVAKDRIESEKKELTLLFESLTSKIKDECIKIEKQLGAEIKAYQDIDKALNDKLELLIDQKEGIMDVKNSASTTINELMKQISLAEKATNRFKDNPHLVLPKKINEITFFYYLLLVNVIILDMFFVKWIFF